jgi:hypothetical protein
LHEMRKSPVISAANQRRLNVKRFFIQVKIRMASDFYWYIKVLNFKS